MHDHHGHCGHGCHHGNREKNITRALILNAGFAVMGIIVGLLTNSLAVVSEALHDCGDSLFLIVSLIAEKMAKKKPDPKRTFGYQRLSLFSATFNVVVLMVGSGFILYYAAHRLFSPETVSVDGMIWFALLGIIVNGINYLRLRAGRSQNEKSAALCMKNDAYKWIVIFAGGIVLKFWNFPMIDSILTICLTVLIIWDVIKNSRETINIFLQGVPAHVDTQRIEDRLLKIDGVIAVHDIHVWSLEGETDILTGHIVVDDLSLRFPNQIKKKIKEELTKEHIEHSTIELESEGYCTGDGMHLEK